MLKVEVQAPPPDLQPLESVVDIVPSGLPKSPKDKLLGVMDSGLDYSALADVCYCCRRETCMQHSESSPILITFGRENR